MVCDICGKEQATVHLTEIINDQMSELHLCEACAREKSLQMEQQFGLADLLAGMADFEKPLLKEKEVVSIKCPSCGMAYSDFKKIGRLGCGQCYATFKKYLGPLLKKIHGSVMHFGKSPVVVTKVMKEELGIHDLRLKLQKAIAAEEFEEAARLRDQIKELEKKEVSGETKNGLE